MTEIVETSFNTKAAQVRVVVAKTSLYEEMQTMLGFGQLRSSFLWALAFTSAPTAHFPTFSPCSASGFVHARVSPALCKFAPTPLFHLPSPLAPTFLSFGLQTPWRDTANYTVVNRPANLSRPQFVRLNFSVPYRASPRRPLYLNSLSLSVFFMNSTWETNASSGRRST